MTEFERNLVDKNYDSGEGRHDKTPDENDVESNQVLTLSPTESPTPLPICYPDENGIFGVVDGSTVISAPLRYNYEIETRPLFDGAMLVEKVERAISAKILGEFFHSCTFSRLRRKMEEDETALTGFSSNPNDVVNESGCREKNPANGNTCTSITGKCTLFAEEGSIDYEKAKIRATESIMNAMANDELIHVDENIIKINFIPDVDQNSVEKITMPDPPSRAIAVESTGFNKAYLAFIPFGVVCFAFFAYMMKKNNKSRDFHNLSDEGNNVLNFFDGRINWKDSKLDQFSSVADSVPSDLNRYVNPGDTSSECTSFEDQEISFSHSATGFEISLPITLEK